MVRVLSIWLYFSYVYEDSIQFLVNVRPKHDITKEIMLTNVVVAVFLKLDLKNNPPHKHTHTHLIQEGQWFRLSSIS